MLSIRFASDAPPSEASFNPMRRSITPAEEGSIAGHQLASRQLMSDSTSPLSNGRTATGPSSASSSPQPPRMDAGAMWRCLVASGVNSAIATEVCSGVPRTLTAALRAAALRQGSWSNSGEPVFIDLSDPTEDPEFRELTQLLSVLPEASRRAVLATMIGGLPIERLPAEADANASDLEGGIRHLERIIPGPSLNELFAPVLDIPVPDLGLTITPTGPKWLPAGGLVTAVFVSILFLAAMPQGDGAQPVLEQAPTTTATLATVTSTSTTLANSLKEPDREIEISITDDDTIIRREPWTRKVIWESRPYADVEVLSIDPNTLTITTRGYRLFVSLTDGTLLPP